MNKAYEDELKKISLRREVGTLFKLILKDQDIYSNYEILLKERDSTNKEILKQQSLMSKARRLLLENGIDLEDFNSIKTDIKEALNNLNQSLEEANSQLANNTSIENEWSWKKATIFKSYHDQDLAGKRFIINLFRPSAIDPLTGDINPIIVDRSLAKIISFEKKPSSLLAPSYINN